MVSVIIWIVVVYIILWFIINVNSADYKAYKARENKRNEPIIEIGRQKRMEWEKQHPILKNFSKFDEKRWLREYASNQKKNKNGK
jgi:hypothetical protein